MPGWECVVECSFCHRTFDETAAEAACKGCLSGRGCRLIRCPHCGCEMPREPRSAAWLRRILGKVFRRSAPSKPVS